MKNDSPKQNEKNAKERAEIEAEERRAVEILAHRIEQAAAVRSCTNCAAVLVNPLAVN